MDDSQILDCPLDLSNQKTIKMDALRTRVLQLKKVWTGSKEDMNNCVEKILTYYTKNSNTTYKQGYNELLAPFLWLSMVNLHDTST